RQWRTAVAATSRAFQRPHAVAGAQPVVDRGRGQLRVPAGPGLRVQRLQQSVEAVQAEGGGIAFEIALRGGEGRRGAGGALVAGGAAPLRQGARVAIDLERLAGAGNIAVGAGEGEAATF